MKRAEENKMGRTNKRAKDDTTVNWTFVPKIKHNIPNHDKQ